jgi:hypothetical protein
MACGLLGLVFVYQLYLAVAVVCCWLSGVNCVSLSMVVVSSLLSSVGCRVLIVDCLCRLSHRFLGYSIVGAQLCCIGVHFQIGFLTTALTSLSKLCPLNILVFRNLSRWW